jgi:mono/diheme cytochrome c family protein
MRWVAIAVFSVAASTAQAADVPDFNRDVRPILAARCFKCHGPDDGARKAKLRLDNREGAELAIGKPEKSELVRRITSTNEEEVMPPPALKTPLTAKEKETLKAWIAAGAKYEPHWAFVPPKRPEVPKTKFAVNNPIDNFAFSRLEKEGLKPSPEADRYTLIRRVYLDLIGIPPTPEEVDAFVNDKSPQAYEKVVDKLLASPQYGERWARKWLDLARYADTNGYEKDRQRSIWPYRDWVIKALNDDMPFDRFTIEQLAGDMAPLEQLGIGTRVELGTSSRVIATGFHRNTMLNEEGGIDPLEFRYYAVVDRTNTTGTVWLGLTVGCAQCHTHKFDPISHTEYFRLLAFFNNADEPEVPVDWSEGQTKKLVENLDRTKEVVQRQRAKAETPEMKKAFAAWEAEQRKHATRWTVIRPAKLDGGLTKLTLGDDGSIFATGDTTKRDVYTLTLDKLPVTATAIRLEALPDVYLPGGGPGRTYYEGPKGEFFLSELTLTADGKPVKFASATESGAKDGETAKFAIDGNPLTGWSSGGQFGKQKQAVFVFEKPFAGGEAKLELVFEKYYASSLGRFRVSVTTATANVKAKELPGEVEDALATAAEDRTKQQRDVLLRYWIDTAPEFKAEREELATLNKQFPVAPTTLVMQERPADNPRESFRHHRGEFLQPKEKVEPGVLAVLPGLPKNAPANRLTFAKWLVSPENPLTARVTVNRHWHAFFGRGLVRTLDDFGYQGEPPTNQELLDWLALEFVDRGWSVKTLHKLILMSATYRQSSHITPELLAKDAENKLLARGPRMRLDAEQIRDSALKAAGQLSTKMYGPSVFPPQPTGALSEGTYGGLNWKVSDGEDRYRRGLYTFSKRTAPHAMGGTFDAPSGEVCVARREVTNSALQALTMLNDVVLLDAARALAKRTAEHEGKTEDRVAFLFRLCLVRPPTAEEATRIAKFYEVQKTRFAVDPERADAVAGAGQNAAERAAWTATARAILNLDEFVTKE